MATGSPAFEGKTKTSLIAAIVSMDPRPISEVRPLTPPALDHVIAKCLSKNPDDRWQSAHDVAEELKWIGDTSMTAAAKHGRMSLSRTSALFIRASGRGKAPHRDAKCRWQRAAGRVDPIGQRRRTMVCVRAVAAGSGRTQISIGGGSSPHWAKNGRELFYFNENAMHAPKT